MAGDLIEDGGVTEDRKPLGITVVIARVSCRFRRRIVMQIFAVYVASNMMFCALVFAPWTQPRETVSGLMGRWRETETGWKRIVGRVGTKLVDRIYFWEPDHCVEIYRIEKRVREILYP